MIAIESPEALALRAAPPARYGSLDRAMVAAAIRDDRKRAAAALSALATEWETTAPASSGGYVEALRELAASLGGPGR